MGVRNRGRVEQHAHRLPNGGDRVGNAAAFYPRWLARGERLLRIMQHDVGRVDVPVEGGRRGEDAGPSVLGWRDGLLSQRGFQDGGLYDRASPLVWSLWSSVFIRSSSTSRMSRELR